MKQRFKFFAVTLLLCMSFQNSFSQQNQNGWQWVNSRAQSNTIYWTKIIDETHYYAVGENGTFMKSSDGGDNWRINTQAGITDPMFGSGATFTLSSAWFFNANTGIVVGQSVSGDGGKVRRTTDGGETFNTISLNAAGTGSPRVSDIYFINSLTGYICGNKSIGAFKTTNAGLSWTLLPNLPSIGYYYNAIYAKDENNIILGLNSEGLYRRIIRTTNAGATWTTIDLPWSTIIDVTDIQFQNANTGFISGNSVAQNPPYFAHTTDGGSTWTEAIFPNIVHGLYDLEIIGSTVYVLGGDFNHYYSTTNLGVTWDSVYYGDPSNPHQPFDWFVYTFSIKGNDAIVSGMNGKMNISNDGGSTWRNKNYSVSNCVTQMPSIYALPGTKNVWAGTRSGGAILYSSDRGDTWSKQQTSEQYAFYQINMVNSSTGYAVGGNLFAGVGYCLKTVNGGLNWIKLTIPTPTFEIWSVDFVNANTGWIVGGLPMGYGAVISKTTNGGSTWTNQVATPALNSAIMSIDMSDANTGYIAHSTGMFKTTNGGTNWDKINTVPSTSFRRVHTFSNTTVFASSGQTIYKTLDGGSNWTSVTIPSSEADIFSMDWYDLNNGTVVGTQGYSAKTSDGGLTWTERNTGTSTLWEVSMVSRDTVFAVAGINTNGAIFRLIDSPSSSITLNVKIGIQGFWNGTTQVSDEVKCHLRNSVAPYNEVEVATAVADNTGNASFNFSTAPSGSYYVEVTHRNSIETWSNLPQAVVQGNTYNYDFTTSASQAFGNNMILVSGRYCNYSGDINQDGEANLTDLLESYNASSSFTTGYVSTDITGDLTVDLSDMTMIYNNAKKFVQKVTP